MINNSLFYYFMREHGLNVYKEETTRDIICMDFNFGSRSYEEEKNRLVKLLNNPKTTEESKERIKLLLEKVERNKDKYNKKSRSEIRNLYYNNGVDITYKTCGEDGKVISTRTINYKMLYRTSAKAKLGQAIFIKDTLYKRAIKWLTMGIFDKMPKKNAKIVEISAYAPLTTSTIIGLVDINVRDILILQDVDSFFRTKANVVSAETYINVKGDKTKKCVVTKQEIDIKNTLWDGMGIVESDIFEHAYLDIYTKDSVRHNKVHINGMALLRNHMYKMCALRGHLQLFFKDWCESNGYDYNTYTVQDMFGVSHYLKDIKMITTESAIKWKKFSGMMGNTLYDAYDYWCKAIESDGNKWGIVKTDHKSKLGNYQQLSYQMVNTLPCTRNDIDDIAKTSIDYVELLKSDNNEFEIFLRKNANEINHYEMLADLYAHNHDFADSEYFRSEKKIIINLFVEKLRKGKIFVEGDNLTVFGNPYALLLYSIGVSCDKDTTFKTESDCIQCFTTRFKHGEYLAGFRNPHNSPNNVLYLHNVHNDLYYKYFDLSDNLLFVNNINTDVQDRANGCDYDSDFFLVTNQGTIVEKAKECYSEYYTIVNKLNESGITYDNNMSEYARMDNKFAGSQMGIGWSSNLAQLAMTYYWTEKAKPIEKQNQKLLNELYDNFVILSVLAQVIIDGCKREYEIDGEKEIKRISNLSCMKHVDKDGNKKDRPLFMKYTREIKYTKDGKELPIEVVEETKKKENNRLNDSFKCPMNYLQERLNKIQGSKKSDCIPTKYFFIKMKGRSNIRQVTKILNIIQEYDKAIRIIKESDEDDCDKILDETNNMVELISKIKIGNVKTINRLIEIALDLESGVGASKSTKKRGQKYRRKILNCMYRMNKSKFLSNFC